MNRIFLSDDQIRDLLRGMRDEPVPSDSLVRVRTAVGERIEARRRLSYFLNWKVATALLAAGCLALAAVLLRTDAPAPPPVQAKQELPRELPARQPGIAIPQERKMPRPVVHAVRRVVRPKAEPVLPTAPSAESSDVLIRIETPDPDVVILLVGE
jgi:hypothetical protein